MGGIAAEFIDDLAITTLENVRKGPWADIAHDFQRFVALRQLMQKHKIGLQAGDFINFEVRTSRGVAGKNVLIGEPVSVNIPNMFSVGRVDWRHSRVPWAYNTTTLMMNRSPERIISLLTAARLAAFGEAAELMEENWWRSAGIDDNKTPFPLAYWVVKNATKGFNGGNPTGFSAGAAGLISSTFPNWANWTDQYTDITQDDAVMKMTEAFEKTRFEAPFKHEQHGSGNRALSLFMNYDTWRDFIRIAQQQNDRIGFSLNPAAGKVNFHGVVLEWVPALASDTSNPIYFVDFDKFKFVFLKGRYMTETGPLRPTVQPDMRQNTIDWTYNTICYDRRGQAVLRKAA